MAGGTHTHGMVELKRARWSSAMVIVAGIWLMASPFVLEFYPSASALWNHVLIGAPVTGVAIVRTARPDYRPEMSWINGIMGLWMIGAPFLVPDREPATAMYNSVLTGAIIVALALFSAYETNRAPIEPDRGPLA